LQAAEWQPFCLGRVESHIPHHARHTRRKFRNRDMTTLRHRKEVIGFRTKESVEQILKTLQFAQAQREATNPIEF
jgi:hypothetical protein